jgi:hypothetical protein
MICIYFGCRLETITTSRVGHARRVSVHCAGRLSRELHNILVPGDASNILQIPTDTAICGRGQDNPLFGRRKTDICTLPLRRWNYPKFLLMICIYTRIRIQPQCFLHFEGAWLFKSPSSCIVVVNINREVLSVSEELDQECQFLVTCQVFRFCVCFLL